MKCIYCLEDKPKDQFTKAEHVIPQAFGLFKDNFTLNEEVCDECNQYLGDNLEIDLGRDTIEGISRYKFGIKSAKDFKSLGERSRFTFVVVEGPLKGAFSYLEYSKELDDVSCKPLPQVGFINRATNEYKYFLLDEIPNKQVLDEQELDYSKDVRALGADFDEIRDVLSKAEIPLKFEEDWEFDNGDSGRWLIEIEGSIDQTICRAIAKISFNYMAYLHGAEFVLQKEFDPIRFYIRRGEQAKKAYVWVRNENILMDEDKERPRLFHIVTLNWSINGEAIVSQVSLFNSFLSYTVQLTKHYRGEKHDIRKGHCFNLGDNKIYELTPFDKNSNYRLEPPNP